ncbi:hypothetical protein Emag_005094 [Eimeria magna]
MGKALPAAAFTTVRQWLFSTRLNLAGQDPLHRGLPERLLCHARRKTAASALDGSIALFDALSKTAQQEQGLLLSKVFGATRGDYTSADPSRLQQKARAATTRSGWEIPRVAVAVFHAEWSASCADLQRWLTDALASKARDEACLELLLVSSDTSPLLTKLYNVTSIPHCVLLLKGCVALELPAAASDARRAAFAASVAEAAARNVADASPRELMQVLLSMTVPHATCSVPSPAVGQRVKEGHLLSGVSMKSSDEKITKPLGSYVFDGDERVSRVAALGTVALFDAPGVSTEVALNANLFSKARGAQPPRRPKRAVSSDAFETFEVPQWQLSVWVARTRRCLAARLFLESAEDAALSLATKSHGEWLAAASACNFMPLRLERREACELVGGSEAFRAAMQEVGSSGEKARHGAAVHPLDAFSEPRAPSPGRALLSSMYAALGRWMIFACLQDLRTPAFTRVSPIYKSRYALLCIVSHYPCEFDERRQQRRKLIEQLRMLSRLLSQVTAAGFRPTRFSHTRARRGDEGPLWSVVLAGPLLEAPVGSEESPSCRKLASFECHCLAKNNSVPCD